MSNYCFAMSMFHGDTQVLSEVLCKVHAEVSDNKCMEEGKAGNRGHWG